MNCPRCGRPVAIARPHCLYCGAALPPEALAAASAVSEPTPPVPGLEQPGGASGVAGVEPSATFLVLALEGTDPGVLASALGLSAYEAAQRLRRGGLQLHRVLSDHEAEA